MSGKIIDPDLLPLPTVRNIVLDEFYAIEPFPGHRDSEGRAQKAEHLFHFEPEHCKVEIGEITLPDGSKKLYRFTGNTRAAVWRCALSNEVPKYVQADIYPCRDLDHIRHLGMRFDSQAAAWNRKDWDYRVMGIAYDDKWRPTSKIAKLGTFSAVVRQVAAYERGVYSNTGEKAEVEAPKWTREIQILDRLCAVPFDRSDAKPFRVGILSAVALLLRHEKDDDSPKTDQIVNGMPVSQPTLSNEEKIYSWFKSALADEGTKEAGGMDGIQYLVEVFRLPTIKRGRNSTLATTDLAKKTLIAYFLHRDLLRVPKFATRIDAKTDPVDYCAARNKGIAITLRIRSSATPASVEVVREEEMAS